MRYAVVSKGLTVSQIEAEVRRYGGRNVKIASASKIVFCDLEQSAVDKLKTVPGLAVKETSKKISVGQAPPPIPPTYPPVPVYAASLAGVVTGFYQLREMISPPITGQLATIAILDSGIRKTHQGLQNKVIHEANFTNSPTVDDILDHGTGVAFCAAGGRHAPGEESGAAPGAYLWNIKVLGDDGRATEEEVIMGIEHVIRMREEALARGLSSNDPMMPTIINMSWGAPDDGDPDNPIRVACRAAAENLIWPNAAAGNDGPSPTTITVPAVDPLVAAVGAVTFSPFEAWEFSSRGPTKEGVIKPDVVFYGIRILTASSGSDEAFTIKSGTSFSCPYFSGIIALSREAVIRILGPRYLFVQPPTDEQVIELARRILGAAPLMKPPGAPAVKDNTYGHGVPLGTQLQKVLVPGVDTRVIGQLLGLGVLSATVAGIVRQ